MRGVFLLHQALAIAWAIVFVGPAVAEDGEAAMHAICLDGGRIATAASCPLVQFQSTSPDPLCAMTLARKSALGQHDKAAYQKLYDDASQAGAAKEFDALSPGYQDDNLVVTGALHLGPGAGLSYCMLKLKDGPMLPVYDVVLHGDGGPRLHLGWNHDNIAYELTALLDSKGAALPPIAKTGMRAFFVKPEPAGPVLTQASIPDTEILYVRVESLDVGTNQRPDRLIFTSDDEVAVFSRNSATRVYVPRVSRSEQRDIALELKQVQLAAILGSPELTRAIFEDAER